MRVVLCTFLEISFETCEGLISLGPYLQKSEALLEKLRVCSKLSDFFLPSVTSQLPNLILPDGRFPFHEIPDKWKCGRKKG